MKQIVRTEDDGTFELDPRFSGHASGRPEEAIDCFLPTKMDVLIVDDTLLLR